MRTPLPPYVGSPSLHLATDLPWFADPWTTPSSSLSPLHRNKDHLLSHNSSSYVQLPTDAKNAARVRPAESRGKEELNHHSTVPSCKTLICPSQRCYGICYERRAVTGSPKSATPEAVCPSSPAQRCPWEQPGLSWFGCQCSSSISCCFPGASVVIEKTLTRVQHPVLPSAFS